MNGAERFVAALENEGVDRIFGLPGEENLDIVEAIRKSSIQLVLTRHEQAAAFMAATYGRLTGKPGVCITTLGPGALNLTTGAAYALLGAMPMIMITGQKGILSSRQARFQIVDIVAAMKPLTKLSRQIVSTKMITTLVREAFRVAEEERPGPVQLELPEDIAAAECEDTPLIPPHALELPCASPAALDRAAERILKAERPLVMLGAAASRPRSTADLAQFVLIEFEIKHLEVFADARRRDRFRDHDKAAVQVPAHHDLRRSLLVFLGQRLDQRLVEYPFTTLRQRAPGFGGDMVRGVPGAQRVPRRDPQPHAVGSIPIGHEESGPAAARHGRQCLLRNRGGGNQEVGGLHRR